MGRYQEIYSTLSDTDRIRSDMLDSALQGLDVKEGIREKLQCQGHFGKLGDPIWKYICMLRTSHQFVKDKGAWLMKCLEEHYK